MVQMLTNQVLGQRCGDARQQLFGEELKMLAWRSDSLTGSQPDLLATLECERCELKSFRCSKSLGGMSIGEEWRIQDEYALSK